MFGWPWQDSRKKIGCGVVVAIAFLPRPVFAQFPEPDAITAVLNAQTPQTDLTAVPVAPTLKQPAAEAHAPEAALPKPAPEELYLSKDPQPTFSAETVDLTEEAARRYLTIVEAGGWPAIPTNVKLVTGVSGPAVALLKRRLIVTGDLDAAAEPGDTYDATVEAAVKHYQESQGLEQTGAVGGQTLRALNVTAIQRYNQLLASAKRLRATKFGFGPRYVVVNIPSANVEAIEAGKVVRRYIAVVGKTDHPSPTVEAKITQINLNPTWTVPASIVKNEMIPHMQANPGYLAKEHIRIFDQTGAEINPTTINWATNSATAFTLRQDSGASNSLGTLRIDMPNKDAVYMHDTPSKGLFSASVRFGSHGCVRVSKVQDLAAWLMENNTSAEQASANPAAPNPSGWSPEMISAAIALGTRMDIKLTKPVPVAWVYLTGYATPDHVAHFRNDVYDLDSGVDTTASIPTPRQQAPVATIAASPSKPSAAPAPAPKAPVAKSFVERDARPIPQAE
jgi:murein L,D-transpeptidase YcbB/YkuD